MLLLEKEINYIGDCPFDGVFSAGRMVFEMILHFELEFHGQVPVEAGMELKELKATCGGCFCNCQQSLVAQLLQENAHNFFRMTVIVDQLVTHRNSTFMSSFIIDSG